MNRSAVILITSRSKIRKQLGEGGKAGETSRPVRQLSMESLGAGQQFNEFLKSLNKDVQCGVSKLINNFLEKMLRVVEFQAVDESSEQVQDFYTTMNDMITQQPVYEGLNQEQIDKINELTERYITTRLYKQLNIGVNAVCEEKDLAIQNRIRSLAWVSSQHLECGVQESSQEVRETLDSCCAVAFIEHVTAQSLGLTEDEYQRYMTGLALPPHALDGDAWLCEGMRVMQQNLKTLDDLQAKMEHLVTHSDELMQEMDELQESVSKEVASVLEKNPLTIHPCRKVAIDEELPASPLLPSPLTPEASECTVLFVDKQSPDIIAAQQSLSFLQQLGDGGSQTTSPDLPDASTQASKSTSRNASKSMGSEADLLSLDIDLEETDNSMLGSAGLLGSDIDLLGPDADFQEVKSGMVESASGLPDLIGPIRSTENSKITKNHKDFLNLEEIGSNQVSNQGMFALNQSYSSMSTKNMMEYSSPQTKSEKHMSDTLSRQASLPYSGFTIQGGKIPSIACDTGNTHSLSSPHEQSQPGSSDPLSPPLVGSHPALPPPLIPSVPGERQEAGVSGQKSSEKKGDALDKTLA
ncbi:Rab5 GDP/GTP exchange factor [Portunus trituberculatus]|uniref:Rab5 GDP/GTP exchange factor n=1 Tax=Portunus trituberculatus TaxID=210409 RepID=A0A5B7D9X3_PORTR|nr:Rab5 GDP/GTP exchange factor [Portunus trituberculatus]